MEIIGVFRMPLLRPVINPATGQPFWTAKSHVDLDGEAKKIDGRWLLTRVSSSAVPVPVPAPVPVP